MVKFANPPQLREEFARRTDAIRSVMQKGALTTREDAVQLLGESGKKINSCNLQDFQGGMFNSEYTQLNAQIKALRAHANKLPTREQLSLRQAEQALREKVNLFNAQIQEIDANDSCKQSAQALKETLNGLIHAYCDEKPLTRESLKTLVGAIGKEIQQSQPNFESKSWHLIADLAMTLLNGLTAVVRGVGLGNMRLKLFSQQGQEAEKYAEILTGLESSVNGSETAPSA